jgi:arylsulfatase
VKDGSLCYEYNLFEVMRTQIKAKEKLPLGKVKIEVQTSYVVPNLSCAVGRTNM